MAAGKKHRLLIVDDSRETVAGLRAFFHQRYDVIEAHTADEGLHLLQAERPPVDLVISDLLMPGTSGVAFISMLKAEFPGIPVIAITGWAGESEELVRLCRADVLLYKPFDLEVLDGNVRRLLAEQSS